MAELLSRFHGQEDVKVGDFTLLFCIRRLSNVKTFKTHILAIVLLIVVF